LTKPGEQERRWPRFDLARIIRPATKKLAAWWQAGQKKGWKKLSPAIQPPGGYSIFTVICLGLISSFLGQVMVKTPFL